MSHQSLLWSIVPAQGKPSWLFGTMHIRDDRAYRLCENLYPLILQSDVFIGEMDLSQLGQSQDMPTYDMHQYFSDKTYQKVNHQIKKSFGVNLDRFTHLHPLMIMSIISTSGLQSEHHISLDEHLWQFAKSHGKETKGLESLEEQSRILHSIDPAPIYRQILKISRNPASMRKHSHGSLDLYTSGNIHKLYMLSKASMQHLREKVIYNRNRDMASVIDHLDLLSTQYFISVGAGHLSGKFGLLPILKSSGWKVRPIRQFNALLKEQP